MTRETVDVSYNATIRNLVTQIEPLDALERSHKEETLAWIESGVELCRRVKPDKPFKHLVAYTLPYDSTGRELQEKLRCTLSLCQPLPIFLSVT